MSNKVVELPLGLGSLACVLQDEGGLFLFGGCPHGAELLVAAVVGPDPNGDKDGGAEDDGSAERDKQDVAVVPALKVDDRNRPFAVCDGDLLLDRESRKVLIEIL